MCDRSRYMLWVEFRSADSKSLRAGLTSCPQMQRGNGRITESIERELDYLDGLSSGGHSYTGMLQALVAPA